MNNLPTILRSTVNKHLASFDLGVHLVYENQLTKVESIPGEFYAEVKMLGPNLYPSFGLDVLALFSVQVDVYQRAQTGKHNIYALSDKAGAIMEALRGPIVVVEYSQCLEAERLRLIPKDKVVSPMVLLGASVIANYTLDLEIDR